MKSLIVIFLGISFSSLAQGELIRDTLIGVFSKYKTTVSIGQQVAQQGAGYSFEVERAYLKIGGQDYKIYRLTQKEILELDPPSENQQQKQRRPEVLAEDYFLKGNFESNDKIVLIEGFIDKEKRIIYGAKFISALSDDEIVEALNKCLLH
ncbi:hypothetical protein IT397_00430 [Candidatus Nomurabacteria bacterium]|nr:hypothetical protein [Candidatus Nomurabacteria bacterium]